MIGPVEFFLVLAIVGLLVGAKKLPRIARAVGRTPGEYLAGKKQAEDTDTHND